MESSVVKFTRRTLCAAGLAALTGSRSMAGQSQTHAFTADTSAKDLRKNQLFLDDTWISSWPPFFALVAVPVAWLWRAIPGMLPRLAVVYCINLTLTVVYVVLCVSTVAGPKKTAPKAAASSANLYFMSISSVSICYGLLTMTAGSVRRLMRVVKSA